MSSDPTVREMRRQRFRLADGVVASPQRHRGVDGYHLEIPQRGEFIALGAKEGTFLSLLNGERSFAEAVSLAARVQGAQAPTEAEALQFCTRLLEAGVLVLEEVGGTLEASGTPGRRSWNPFWMQQPLLNPDRLLSAVLPLFRWMFHPLAALAAIGLMAVALATIGTNWVRFAASAGEVFARDNWVWLGAAWLGLKLLHELSHALACKHYGGDVREMGVVFILFAPMAYVDVTSSWRLRSRWRRMHIAAAGMWMELTLAAAAALVWSRTDSAATAHRLYNVILLAGVTTLLFNLNPLMKFDGYYILSDWLDLPNLAQRGSEAVRRCIVRWMFGLGPSVRVETGAARWLVLAYGLAASVWRIVVVVGLMLAASVMFRGAGIALAAAGALIWLGQPLLGAARFLQRLLEEDRWAAVRGGLSFAVLAALVAAPLALAPNPRGAVAPGVIDFAEADHVRATGDGFVTAIHVRDGEYVAAGTLLFELTNEPLVNELRDLELQWEQSEVQRLAAANANEPGKAQIEAAQQASLQKRWEERQRQVERLSMHAPHAGQVIARRLQERLGQYVHEGDELCVLGEAAGKEVILAVDQPMLRRIALGETLTVRTSAGLEVSGRVSRVTPRAKLRAPHPSLCAINGGPLPNGMPTGGDAETDSPPLLTPVIDARLTLSPETAERLSAGQLCYATTHAHPEGLGLGLWRAARDWVTDRLESLEAAQN